MLLLGKCGTGKATSRSPLASLPARAAIASASLWPQPLVSELIEARDEKKLLRFHKQIASYELLIVDELGFVPLSKTGAELLFEMLSQR